uniref:AD domain-containing protein n=1 Tax=Aceria tosichella TaxID=561515 RepID=A0A6G1SDS3_9ACAR
MAHYEKAKELLYTHVNVETNIKKSKDFTSDFLLHSKHLDESTIPDKRRLTFTGYLKAIDPISHSVILCQIERETRSINNILILGRNICDIHQSTSDPDQDYLSKEDVANYCDNYVSSLNNHPYFCKPSTSLTSQELIESQTRIVSWLKKYRIPIELDEKSQELVVAECVRIKPPYKHESDFICPTRVVLKRIKNIVDMSLSQEIPE